MLILARRKNERIIINESLIIEVTAIDYICGQLQVKLGFEGSLNEFVIDRYEIYERKLAARGD